MVDDRLAGSCTNVVGVALFVGTVWSAGGSAWLVGVWGICMVSWCLGDMCFSEKYWKVGIVGLEVG